LPAARAKSYRFDSVVQHLASRVLRKAKVQLTDSDLGPRVIQLVEGLLMSRFPQFDREEVRMKFKLHDIRESKVWKEAHEGGIEEGKSIAKKEVIQTCFARGMSLEQIAELVKLTPSKVQELANNHAH
jgi:predicted transposase YdaD